MEDNGPQRQCTAEELFGGKWPLIVRTESDRLRRERLHDIIRRYPLELRDDEQMAFLAPIDDMTDEERDLMFRWLLTKPAHQSQGVLRQLRRK